MTAPDRPDAPLSNVDDPEWIKGVVAKALLHAADDLEGDPPLAPTPQVRPVAAWPEMAPLDTSAFAVLRSGGDEVDGSVIPAPPSAGRTQDPAPPTLEPTSQEVATRPTPAPTLELEPQPTQQLTDHDKELVESEDDVMSESTVTTEGFRSSDIRTVLEWLAVIVTALIVALVIKAVVLQAFWIPSESMETTVNKGDRILVNKVSYRLHEVRRGDLVVFEKLEGTPGDTKDLIKRAIALPGETIEIRNDGRIWIWSAGETAEDAKLLEEPYLDPQNAILNAPSASDPLTADVWDERCTNQPRTPGRCTLDDTSFFMMGDNRNRSSDSRFFGPVPEDNIVGRAFLRIWPLGEVGTL